MIYKNIIEAIFIDRPNRFVAIVSINGKIEAVHVKNTGRCKELLIPDAKVILCISDNSARKTKYDLISVYKEGLGWVNLDSQVPNTLFKEWVSGKQVYFRDLNYVKPECKYGMSRIDFYLECNYRKIFIEIKSCTLEIDKIGYFPDAPTERGVKHINELISAVNEGYECYIAFVITMNGVTKVRPNIKTHPEFADALIKALNAGVKIIFFSCDVKSSEINISNFYVIDSYDSFE